jgi:hypothetical protein
MKHISILQLRQFDPITRFRLINAFIVSIGMGLLTPVIVTLKGTLLPIWVISMFGIINTLSVKTNNYFSKKPLNWLYRTGVILHILFVLTALLYFWNPLIMILLDSTLVIAEIAIFSAYGIVLNNYITDAYPDSMNNFQIVRNNTWADGTLIGLTLAALITSFFGLNGMIISFVVFNTCFSLWMLMNWNFYEHIN